MTDRCTVVRLARADVVLTTYNIVSKEVGITEDMKQNKRAHEMPATDAVRLSLIGLAVVISKQLPADCIAVSFQVTPVVVCQILPSVFSVSHLHCLNPIQNRFVWGSAVFAKYLQRKAKRSKYKPCGSNFLIEIHPFWKLKKLCVLMTS